MDDLRGGKVDNVLIELLEIRSSSLLFDQGRLLLAHALLRTIITNLSLTPFSIHSQKNYFHC